jgi:hypothetical protein
MAQNNGNFTAKRVLGGKEISCLRKETTKKCYDVMSVSLDDESPSYYTVKNWVATFGTGHLSTEDKERSGRTHRKRGYPQNYWVSELCPSSRILYNRKQNVSDAGPVSVLRRVEGDTYSVQFLRES